MQGLNSSSIIRGLLGVAFVLMAAGCETSRSTTEVSQSRQESEPQMTSPGQMQSEGEMVSPGTMIIE